MRREVPNVGLVQIQVDEAPEPAVLLDQVALETSMGGEQPFEHLADRIAGKLDGILAGGETPKRGRDGHSDRHGITPQ
jgi:hypothetical protein